ncbi:MAG: DUF5667 domain-containing protein [Candidatus Falkowbacteria bacterium]|nr:DUF5667 domain-containing protein [Candidatus Falkowbacteria bacterium]
MTERELIKNLSALKNIEADSNWVKSNREVLLYQIFNGAEYVDMPLGFFEKFSLISKRILQPTPIAAVIALFFVMSGVVSVRMSRNATPGEPLYVAKSISEKAQLLATFNETAKAKLNVEFATQRVAEIEKVVSEDKQDNNDARVQELATSFKNEINTVRDRLTKIKTAKKPINPQTASKDTKDNDVVSAELSKDNNGIDIASPDNQKTLSEAEKLFNDKNYNGAAAKLDELGKQLK